MKSSEKKLSFRSRMCHALDLSPNVLPHTPLLELHGDSLLKIQGGGKILLYTPEEIRFSLKGRKDFCLSVVGVELSCSSYNMGTVGIEGKILSLSFVNTKEEVKK